MVMKPLEINNNLETIIKNNIMDMFVFSNNAQVKSSNFFQRLLQTDSTYKIGTELDTKHKDMSINRCPVPKNKDQKTFLMFTNFRVSKRTPREENDCTGWIFSSLQERERNSLCTLSEYS